MDVTLFDQTRGRRQACIQWMSIAEQTDETKGLDRRFDELDLDLVVEEDFFFLRRSKLLINASEFNFPLLVENITRINSIRNVGSIAS